jgi:hypothetical protein
MVPFNSIHSIFFKPYLLARALVQGRAGLLGRAQSVLRTALLEFAARSIPERLFVRLFGSLGDFCLALELCRRRRALSQANAFLP